MSLRDLFRKRKDKIDGEIQYEKGANGKEIKFRISPFQGRKITKHEASKPGAKHITKSKRPKKAARSMTNHGRVVAGRAKKMKISVEQYKERYCNGAGLHQEIDR